MDNDKTYPPKDQQKDFAREMRRMIAVGAAATFTAMSPGIATATATPQKTVETKAQAAISKRQAAVEAAAREKERVQQVRQECTRFFNDAAANRKDVGRPVTGPYLGEIQKQLIDDGFTTGGRKENGREQINGRKGPTTDLAIRQWQELYGPSVGLTDVNGAHDQKTLKAMQEFDKKTAKMKNIPVLKDRPGQPATSSETKSRAQSSTKLGLLHVETKDQDLYKKLVNYSMNAPQNEWQQDYHLVRHRADLASSLSDDQFLLQIKKHGAEMGLSRFAGEINIVRLPDGTEKPVFKTTDPDMQRAIVDLRFTPEVSAMVLAHSMNDIQREMQRIPGHETTPQHVFMGYAIGVDNAKKLISSVETNPNIPFKDAFPGIEISGTIDQKTKFSKGSTPKEPTVGDVYNTLMKGYDTGNHPLRLTIPPKGTPNEATRELQKNLKILGFDIGSATPSGVMTPRTELALKEAEQMIGKVYPDALKKGGVQNAVYKLARAAEADSKAFTVTNTAVTASIRMATMAHPEVDMSYYMATGNRESGFELGIKASTSSATGLFQFIDSTWLEQVKKHGEKHGLKEFADQIEIHKDEGGNEYYRAKDPVVHNQILNLRNSPHYSALMMAEYTNENRMHLSCALGRQPSQGELYLAHFMGSGKATIFLQELKKDPNQPASTRFASEADSNPSVFYNKPDAEGNRDPKTLKQIMNEMDGSFNTRRFHSTETLKKAEAARLMISDMQTPPATYAPSTPPTRPRIG